MKREKFIVNILAGKVLKGDGHLKRLFPKAYDLFMRPLEKKWLFNIRKALITEASGEVLEIGSGTGINFPFYQEVSRVTAIEPQNDMSDRAVEAIKSASVPINIVDAPAEHLPFRDGAFDTVVATLVFCTIENERMALEEILRVLKPGGKLLMFEHIKMEQKPFLGRLQNRLTPLWKHLCDGCHLDRQTDLLLERSKFIITEKQYYAGGLFVTIKAERPE